MRFIDYQTVVDAVAELCKQANFFLGKDVSAAFREALKKEKSEIGQDILKQLIRNAEVARTEFLPMCQDTGTAVFIVEVGSECHVSGGTLTNAINEGVRKGYKDHYLRHSMVRDPLGRKNTGDNTPAIIHYEFVEGDRLRIQLSAKGGGAENMSALKMLPPSAGIEGIKTFVIDVVKAAGPNACPPLVVGVGIGGNFEKCAYLAKKSLFRPIGDRHPDQNIRLLEEELIEEINRLGIGPQGLGGSTTALDVKIEVEACHIASLPVAVNLNCHASRHKEVIL